MIVTEILKQVFLLILVSFLTTFVIKSVAVCSDLRNRWEEEVQLRECGRQITAMKNLESAALVLANRYPAVGQIAQKRLAELSMKISKERGGVGCYSEKLHTKAVIYREFNPNIPIDWPNWSYALLKEK